MPGARISLPALLALALSLVLTAAAAGQGRGGVTLRWNWEEDRELVYDTEQSLSQQIDGAADSSNDWTIRYRVKQVVKSVDASGFATVEQTYESGRIEASEDGGPKLVYDSAKDAEQDRSHRLILPFAAFIGKTITFEVGPEGEVRRVTGASRILDGALAGISADVAAMVTIAMYRQALSDDGVRRQLESALRIVPDKPVRRGDSWEVTVDQSTPVGVVRSEVVHAHAPRPRARRPAGGRDRGRGQAQPARRAGRGGPPRHRRHAAGEAARLEDRRRYRLHHWR